MLGIVKDYGNDNFVRLPDNKNINKINDLTTQRICVIMSHIMKNGQYPTAPAIYSFWELHDEEEDCLYVGSTQNLRTRIIEHRLLLRYLGERVQVKYKLCGLEQARKAEAIMIAELTPRLNQKQPFSNRFKNEGR